MVLTLHISASLQENLSLELLIEDSPNQPAQLQRLVKISEILHRACLTTIQTRQPTTKALIRHIGWSLLYFVACKKVRFSRDKAILRLSCVNGIGRLAVRAIFWLGVLGKYLELHFVL